ncbi:hypothetical protein [Microcystis phage Mel-JY34]
MAINIFDSQSPVAMAHEVYGVPLPGVPDSGLPPNLAAFSQAKNAGFEQMVAGAKPTADWGKALQAIMGAMAVQPYNYGGAPQAPSGAVRVGDAPKARNFTQMPAPKQIVGQGLGQIANPTAVPGLEQLIYGRR